MPVSTLICSRNSQHSDCSLCSSSIREESVLQTVQVAACCIRFTDGEDKEVPNVGVVVTRAGRAIERTNSEEPALTDLFSFFPSIAVSQFPSMKSSFNQRQH